MKTLKINYNAQNREYSRSIKTEKAAFTLAEVLITLAVIGIVAALTIGIFLPKIHSKIRAHQIAVAETKFTKAMEQMALNNAIGPYYETTQEFVDELQNYLKISKVCANDKLEECFGYEKIKLKNGEEFEVKKIKDGRTLGMKGEGTDYKETIGLVTIDGTGMILSWDKNCKILEPKVYAWGENTNETTSCVAAIMDINLDKSPNTQNKDVVLFRANNIAEACGMEFELNGNKYCWSAPFSADEPMTQQECLEKKETLGINCCYGTDYWAKAVEKCGGVQNMPDREALADFAKYLYGANINLTDESYVYTRNLQMDTTALNNVSSELSSIFANNNRFILWSGSETLQANCIYNGAWGRRYYATGTDSFWYTNYTRSYSGGYAVCLMK